MPHFSDTVSAVIGAIGRPDFPCAAASSVCDLAGFELSAIFVHAPGGSVALHDNFDLVGCRAGVERYVRHTCRINPILAACTADGVYPARDFAAARPIAASADHHLVHTGDEELGFRTRDWPERQEEILLCFAGWGGLVEFGLYRTRGSRAAPAATLRDLAAVVGPLSAAFERHHALCPQARTGDWREPLSPREREICALMLAGCSSEAIALRLGITRLTVKDHRKRIFRKLGIGALGELFALDRGIPPRGDGAAPLLLRNARH